MKTTLLYLLTLGFWLPCIAQDKDTIMSIPEVEVVDRAIKEQRDIANKTIRSVDPGRSLSSLLQLQNGFYVKSQGVGALSTISYKGLGAMHIPVSINGFLLQSSMNGGMDLSLIPSFHFSSVATGDRQADDVGSVNMGPKLDLKSGDYSGSRLMLGVSSLLNLEFGTTYGNKGKIFDYNVSAYGKTGKNRTHLGHYGEDRILPNTGSEHYSVMQRTTTRLGNRTALQNMLYVQYSDRHIPASLHTAEDAEQLDINAMLGTQLTHHTSESNSLTFSNIIWREKITYSSEMRDMLFPSSVLNANSQLRYRLRLNDSGSLAFSIANEESRYESEALQEPAQWSRWRFGGDYSQNFRFSQIQLNYQALVYANQIKSIGSIGFKQRLNRQNNLSLKLNRVFRLPTLNELYWYEPGFARGNLSLLPEEGYRADLIWQLIKHHWNQTVNVFYGQYDQLIQWRGFPVVMPVNLDPIRTYGIEYKIQLMHQTDRVDWIIDHNQHWVIAQEQKSKDQLIYTPRFTSNITLTAKLPKFAVYVNGQYVDRNYYSSDNLLYLEPYTLFELGAYKRIMDWQLGLRIGNLTNSGYFSIPQRPQSGFNINLNINYTIKN